MVCNNLSWIALVCFHNLWLAASGGLQYLSSGDWLVKNFDNRQAARTGEIDALGKAKAVLSGADFSLVQTGMRLRGSN